MSNKETGLGAPEVSVDADVVVFGYRPGALHAASRLGLRVFLVDEKDPTDAARKRISGSLRTPLEDDPEALAERVLIELGHPPRAVVASGERGVLAAAALRERSGLDGVDLETARRARDKPSMKAAARAAGVRCTDWRTLDESARAADLIDELGLPLVFKKRAGCGAAGLMVANDEADAQRDLASIPNDERALWMAERFIRGTEMSVESFVVDGEVRFVNPTEYYVVGFSNIAPAALPADEADAIFELNRAALAALGIERGMTHLELYRTAEGPVFGEVAVRPPGGRLMRLIRRAYAFDPWEAVIRLELGAAPHIKDEVVRAAGVWMLHPGPGRVVSVRGVADARRVEGVRKLVCRIRAGREVEPRRSTGNDVGWIEVSGRTRDEVADRLDRAHAAIRIQMAT